MALRSACLHFSRAVTMSDSSHAGLTGSGRTAALSSAACRKPSTLASWCMIEHGGVQHELQASRALLLALLCPHILVSDGCHSVAISIRTNHEGNSGFWVWTSNIYNPR